MELIPHMTEGSAKYFRFGSNGSVIMEMVYDEEYINYYLINSGGMQILLGYTSAERPTEVECGVEYS